MRVKTEKTAVGLLRICEDKERKWRVWGRDLGQRDLTQSDMPDELMTHSNASQMCFLNMMRACSCSSGKKSTFSQNVWVLEGRLNTERSC